MQKHQRSQSSVQHGSEQTRGGAQTGQREDRKRHNAKDDQTLKGPVVGTVRRVGQGYRHRVVHTADNAAGGLGDQAQRLERKRTQAESAGRGGRESGAQKGARSKCASQGGLEQRGSEHRVCVCVCVPNGYTGGRQWSNNENGDLDHDWWEKKMILLREKRYDLDYI